MKIILFMYFVNVAGKHVEPIYELNSQIGVEIFVFQVSAACTDNNNQSHSNVFNLQIQTDCQETICPTLNKSTPKVQRGRKKRSRHKYQNWNVNASTTEVLALFFKDFIFLVYLHSCKDIELGIVLQQTQLLTF